MARHTMTFIATVLGLFFIYNGFGKLSPTLNSDLHLNMKKHFVNYARVAPLRKYFDKRFKASEYRIFVGGAEIVGGVGMVLSPGRLSLPMAQLLVILASAFMIHTHIVLGDPIARASMLIATSLMVIVQMLFNKFVDAGNINDDKKMKRRSSDADQEEKEEKEEQEAVPPENADEDVVQEKPKTKKQSKKKRKAKAN